MCLALPAQVVEVHGDATGTVELGGVRQRVSLVLLEGVRPGDFLVVHVGYAIARLDEAEARRTIELLRAAAAGAAR